MTADKNATARFGLLAQAQEASAKNGASAPLTEPKRTPGPWRIGDKHGAGADIVGPDGATVAFTMWSRATRNSEANAVLIAAAPELYEALRNLLREIDGEGHHGDICPEEAARALLARLAP